MEWAGLDLCQEKCRSIDRTAGAPAGRDRPASDLRRLRAAPAGSMRDARREIEIRPLFDMADFSEATAETIATAERIGLQSRR
jgi:hypothetical protein